MLGNCYFCRIGTEHRLKDEFHGMVPAQEPEVVIGGFQYYAE